MIKPLKSLLIVLLAAGIAGCKSDLETENDGQHRNEGSKKEQVLKTIQMWFGGDFITETEEPLLRAEDGDTYTAINVWRTEKDKTDAVEEKYAIGLFKNKVDIKIDVVTGYQYRFEASILTEKEDIVYLYNGHYSNPFKLHTNYHPDFDNAWEYEYDIDEFVYTSFDKNGKTVENGERRCFCELYNGTARVDIGKKDWGDYKYPRVKRYYGNLAIYDPEINENVEIPMSYRSFGLKIIVNDLPSGYLTFENGNNNPEYKQDYLTFPNGITLEKGNEWEGLYSMNNLLASSETFKLRFTWHKGGSVTESFTSNVTISPKTKKVLKVKITGTPNVETKGNVTFNMDTDELTLDEEEISHDFN